MASKQRGERLTPEQRTLRDQEILRLFIAGHSEANIARAVDTDRSLVNRRLKVLLAEANERSELLKTQAQNVYAARTEYLLTKAMEQAEKGDLKAIEVARRLLDGKAKVDGLLTGPSRTTAVIPPLSDAELTPEVVVDELAEHRKRYQQPPPAEGAV
ncbi:helix-turn-helix domain-containing protein [Mycolicibacterium sphagni]|uniref:helix-turn-helix domain-containing protein n=1 Tax=Mycolicibacterium sphagni TaxID=1786 RepID=UPI0021F3C19D|nr:hypothetical protein [Mycolicibacterium sphagni]MCV7174923.1 helix-turn-helix domain-containing protein [Mycolicibacterium sphagni]